MTAADPAAAAIAADAEGTTPARHGLRKLLTSYKCNSRKNYQLTGRSYKTITWDHDTSKTADSCCAACINDSKCW